MTRSTDMKPDSTPEGDDRIPGPGDGVQAALAGLSSVDEIIKATAAWLLIPRPRPQEKPIPNDASTVVRADVQWAAAAEAYLEATRMLEAANATLSLAKMALYQLARNPQERGCGVVVKIPGRWPEIDHEQALALLRVDPQRYWDQCVGAEVRVDSRSPISQFGGEYTADQ